MATDARITLTAEGTANVQAALQALTDAAKQANAALKDTGSVSIDSGGKVQGLKKWFDDLTPSTKNAQGAFTDLKGTLSEMWENPTAGVGKFAGAIGGELTSGLGAVGVAAGLTAGALAVVGVAAFELASKAASAGAELDDLADKTGLSVPALSRLSNAASVIGADMGKLTDVVAKLQKNIGENTNEFQSGLQKMGLSTEALKAAGPDRYLEVIAEGLRGIEDPSKRAAAGSEVLGKAYKDVAATLQDLSAGLAMTADIKPWTAEQAAEAEHFEQQIQSMKVHAEAFGMAIGRDLIGPISTFISGVKDAASVVSDLTGGLGGVLTPIYYIREAFNTTSAAIDVYRGKLASLPTVSGPATDGVKALDASTQAYVDSITTAAKSMVDEKTALRELEQAHQKLVAAQNEAAKAAERMRQLWDTYNSVGRNVVDTINRMDGATVEAIRFDLQRGQSVETLTQIYGVHKEQIQAIQAQEKFLASVVDATTKSFQGMGVVVPDLTGRTAAFREELENLSSTFNQFSGGISVAGDQIDHVIIPAFSELPNVVAKNKDIIEGASKATNVWGGALDDVSHRLSRLAGVDLGPLIKQLAQVFRGTPSTGGHPMTSEGLIEGGVVGGLAGVDAVSSGDSAGEALGKVGLTAGVTAGTAAATGATVAGTIALGAATAGIGAAAVGVALLVKHWLSVSQAEKDARSEFQKLQDMYGSLPQTISGVSRAYAALGLSGTKAQHDLQAALDATHVSAEEEDKALAQINAVLVTSESYTTAIAKGVNDLTTAGQAFGGTVPDEFKTAVEQLTHMQGITDEERASLLAMTGDVKPNFEQLTSLAGNYGISLAALGPKFQQANIEGTAKKIYDDFTSLTKAGGEVGGVLFGMSGKISKLVTDSEDFGVAIPENMRPLIQNLFDTGHLLDDNGEKITDLGKITWEDTPLEDSYTKLQGALDRLTDTLNKLPVAAKNAANGMASALSGANGFLPGDGADGIPGRASGGPVYAGQPYIVGELRPELFVPSTNGTILPRVPSGSGASNRALEEKLDAHTREVKGLRADISRMMQEQPILLRHALRDLRR